LVENGKFVDVPGIATDITEIERIGTYFQRIEYRLKGMIMITTTIAATSTWFATTTEN
jgi:hypothetical protein